MPISDHTREPPRPDAVKVSRMNLVWPVTIVFAALVVLTLLWQTAPALALAIAALTLLAGGIALRTVYGTSWTTQLRHLFGGKDR
jgi:hypothetical protein